MKVLKLQVLSGPNVWSNYRKNLIQVKVDLEGLEDYPTDKMPQFTEKIKELLPGLIEHECSEGVHGGFFIRLERGTWLGHVIEHVALELQTMAGMEVGYGRTRGAQEKGVYNIVFAYEIEMAGLYAAEASFKLVEALSRNLPYDPTADIEELKQIKRKYGLGPSTKSIVMEAEKRGIPWKRLSNNSRIQLGYGKNQVRFQATITAKTSASAINTAGNKDDTKRLLSAAHIPVPEGDICTGVEGLMEIIDNIGYPIVIKPLDGNQGKGASININSDQSAIAAFEHALTYGKYVVVEKYIEGDDYRLLVIDGKFCAASRRIPACVVGDGISTIRELIEITNSDPRRGDAHESDLTKIIPDNDTFRQLERSGYTIESVLQEGITFYLKSTANLSTGGTAIDVTDEVCPENRFIAERVAALVGLDICGMDVMATAICRPLRETGGAVLEVNAAPGFRMHLSPSEGKSRNVATAVVDMFYPDGAPSRIPIYAITGTNGKTTTTRLLAHITKNAGFTTGFTTTDGIYIGNYKICDGDTTGPLSAATILSDPTVDCAVLETARGGLLRSGLAFETCDVGIITNIREDHLGLNDIHTLQDLAKVKAIVARSVRDSGWAVLNGTDKHCLDIAAELSCNVALFALDETTNAIQAHINRGGTAAVLDGNEIFILEGHQKTFLANLADIPLAADGLCSFMVENVLASSLGAYTGGIELECIRQALQTFIPSYEQTPGRMNLFEMDGYRVLVDYAHNPHGLTALKGYLDTIQAVRKIGIIAGVGDRRDQDIIEFAEIAAGIFDHIIVRQEHSLRGRTIDEINELIVKGIQKINPNAKIDLVPDEVEAAKYALSIAEKGDFVVALSDQYNQVIAVIKDELQNTRPIAIMDAAELTNSIAS
ncbi:cyanophycin synthetase [Flavobacterium sp.]|uniref:cyanophycin synthetase n=1 Tax=Flavobacterium sp. TaxID=239 RepID=UPI0025E68286|nr:cyanophycin synthetase [Flavobacterium sp.]